MRFENINNAIKCNKKINLEEIEENNARVFMKKIYTSLKDNKFMQHFEEKYSPQDVLSILRQDKRKNYESLFNLFEEVSNLRP